MGHRLSFVSSPESDYDIAAGDSTVKHDVPSHRPTRASSDPSIVAVDNIPLRPAEPPPAPPGPEVQPHLAYDPYYVCTSHGFMLISGSYFRDMMYFFASCKLL